VKREPPGVVGRGSSRSAHAATPLGTRSKARSEVGLNLCRDVAWRGRAGQAFLLREPSVGDGTTANSLAADRRGPRQGGQVVKTKPLARSCLRVLDQSLGPTRARASRNRPLEQKSPARSPGWLKGGLDFPSVHVHAAHFAGNTRSGPGRVALIHALVESESLSLIR